MHPKSASLEDEVIIALPVTLITDKTEDGPELVSMVIGKDVLRYPLTIPAHNILKEAIDDILDQASNQL